MTGPCTARRNSPTPSLCRFRGFGVQEVYALTTRTIARFIGRSWRETGKPPTARTVQGARRLKVSGASGSTGAFPTEESLPAPLAGM